MSTPLPKKLQLKSHLKGIVYNKPENLAEWFPVEPPSQGEKADFIIVFVKNQAAVRAHVGDAVQQLVANGILWFVGIFRRAGGGLWICFCESKSLQGKR